MQIALTSATRPAGSTSTDDSQAAYRHIIMPLRSGDVPDPGEGGRRGVPGMPQALVAGSRPLPASARGPSARRPEGAGDRAPIRQFKRVGPWPGASPRPGPWARLPAHGPDPPSPGSGTTAVRAAITHPAPPRCLCEHYSCGLR